MRGLRRRYVVSAMLAVGLVGCELIVSSTVPDFHCTPGVAGACPENMFCDPGSLACVAGVASEGGLDGGTDRDSPTGKEDADTGSKLAAIGQPCSTGAPCAAGLLCGTPNILTTSIVKTTESICTRTCCTSGDCPDGFVCFGSGTGGNYCVAADRAKRTSGLGAKGPGATCTDNAQCRSGVCSDGHCLDLCCAEDDCTAGTTCRVKSIATPPPARENWVCALPEPGANLVVGAGSCGGSSGTCKNDNCAGFPLRCRPPCCSSAQCPGLASNLSFCSYGTFLTTSSSTKWCFDKLADAGAPVGSACNGNGDCAEKFCDQDTRVCGRVCCRDSDCAESEQCLPQSTGTPLLRCVKVRE